MSSTLSLVTISLTPQDNARLQSLCGPFDAHLQQIEQAFNLILLRRDFDFQLQPNDDNHMTIKQLQQVGELLQNLYVDTAAIKGKVKELDASDIHIAIQESRLLLQHELQHELQQVDSDQETAHIPNVHATTIKTKRGVIKARGANQSRYLQNILKHDITFGIGPAGTGKTYLAVAAAVEALEKQDIRRILLTRPAVEAGEKLGFLPGDLGQKIEPYLRPLYDALFEMLGFEKVEKLIERKVIEIAPLAYMRGRTLNDAFIILDESQNTTIEQMKMFLTRIGFNSKAVITGDVTQVDLPRGQKSGLRHAMEVLQEVSELSFNFFDSHDVVRHPVVAKVVQAYEKWEAEDEQRRQQLAEQRKQEKLAAMASQMTEST